ncbi:hypothetical protein PMAYCL1PPCAC_03292 [Pristionchus mayeri]|uniref:F-box domain-containing protein n=1 Tax=Pristionchus mayeri TaxID=1317129 RepID=A0AAN4Z223_9BILA|nr:hypothetical protein PMAYCL1PPCAC_03292 [Pristionchus mayeri]
MVDDAPDADARPEVPRAERLRVEGLTLTRDFTERHPAEPSTSGLSSAAQLPVILPGDRRSASPVIPALPDADSSPLYECQIDGLLKIFEYLTLRERVRLSQTCRRFHSLLTDNACSSIKGLTVLNMFQRRVWENSMRSNTISSLTLLKMSSCEHITALLRHVRRIDCLKIWFQNTPFVKAVLNAIDDSLLIRGVDVFPYGAELPLNIVAEKFPKIQIMNMRPHGSLHFFDGLPIDSMPSFANLTMLTMDSFEPQPGFAFPPSLKSLDFANRNLRNTRNLFDALEKLNLSILSLSHLKFRDDSFTDDLIWTLSKMPRLESLTLKFCHFTCKNGPNIQGSERNQMIVRAIQKARWDNWTKSDFSLSLRSLNFDLSYDVTWWTMYSLCILSRRKLQSFSTSLTYDDEAHFNSVMRLAPALRALRVSLSFSVMEKDSTRIERFEPVPPVWAEPPELPIEFRYVVSRFEVSYLKKPDLLQNMFDQLCKNVQECKFVCVKGIDDKILELMSLNCPQLRKLSIVSCSNTTEEGLLSFATNISRRGTNAPLNILYKNNGSMIRLFGELTLRETRHHVVRFSTKTFETDSTGEYIYFNDQLLERTITYKNYTPEDSNHLLGLVIDVKEEMHQVMLEEEGWVWPDLWSDETNVE